MVALDYTPCSVWKSVFLFILSNTWYYPVFQKQPSCWMFNACHHDFNFFMITNDDEHRFMCLLDIGYFLFWNASLLFCLHFLLSCLSFCSWFVGGLCTSYVWALCQLYVLQISSLILQLYLLTFKTLLMGSSVDDRNYISFLGKENSHR